MIKSLKLLIWQFMLGVLLSTIYGYKDEYIFLNKPTKVMYIDNSSVCPKLFYSAYRVAKNCSSLNLAANWSALNTDKYFITELLIANNGFSTRLPYMEVNSYDSLDYLDLSQNSLNEFTTDLQLIDCSANYIKEINLNYNLFATFPVFNQSCMHCLRSLKLSNNKNLINLDNPLVYGNNLTKQMPNLQYLDLSYCNLETLNRNNYTLLYHFPSLLYLNLIGNRIKTIYANPFIWTPNLLYLNFDQNLIECNLDTRWLKAYFKNRPPPPKILYILPDGSVNNQTFYSPMCYSVLTNTNESIIDLDDNSFYTNIYLSSSLGNNSQIKASADKSIDLDCQVYSMPTADLWWTFDERVLSRIVSSDSPYQFIENFNSTFNPFNKSSILRIKNPYSGTYSCKATYLNMSVVNRLKNISALYFKVNVDSGPSSGGLSAGAIAGIVIGSILAFLLLCLCLFLCVWCCCYRLGLCCFKKSSSKSSSSMYKKNSLTNRSNRHLTAVSSTMYSKSEPHISEMEEKASGFGDANRSKPNYVINTISKSTTSINNDFNNDRLYQAPAGITGSSWRIIKPSGEENQSVIISASGAGMNTATNSRADLLMTTSDDSSKRSNQNDRYNIYNNSEPETFVYNVQSSSNNAVVSPRNFRHSNEAYVSDTNLDYENNYPQQASPSATSGGANKRYVETTQYSSNRYVPTRQNDGEIINENYFNQIVIDDENYSSTTSPPPPQVANKANLNTFITQSKQYNSQNTHHNNANAMMIKNVPINTTYPKYDSDV